MAVMLAEFGGGDPTSGTSGGTTKEFGGDGGSLVGSFTSPTTPLYAPTTYYSPTPTYSSGDTSGSGGIVSAGISLNVSPVSVFNPRRESGGGAYGEGGLYTEFDYPLLQFLRGGHSPEYNSPQAAKTRNLLDLLLIIGIGAVLLK